MNQFAALLMPSVLPNAAAATASAANVAAQGQQTTAAFGQFQALLAAMTGDATAPTSEGGEASAPLAVFGVKPPQNNVKTEATVEQLLNPHSLEGAAASATDQTPASVLVDPIFAQFAAPLVVPQQQPLTGAPKTETKATETKTTEISATGSKVDAGPSRPAPQLGLRSTIAPTQSHADVATQALAPATNNTPSALAQSPVVNIGADAQPKQKATQTSAPAPAKATAAPKRSSSAEHPTQTKAASTDGTAKAKSAESVQPSATTNTASAIAPQTAAAQTAPNTGDSSQAPAAPQPIAVASPAPLPAVVELQQVNTASLAAAQAGVPLDALAVHIARKFESGSNQFEIRLHPAELGQLDISLTVADDGQVQAVLRADRPETLDILQRDARALEQQLRQAGLEVGSNALSFSLSSGNGQRHAPFTGWPGFADAQGLAGAAKEEAVASYVAVRTRDGVDIRV